MLPSRHWVIAVQRETQPIGRPPDTRRPAVIEVDRDLAWALALDVVDKEPRVLDIARGLDLDRSDAPAVRGNFENVGKVIVRRPCRQMPGTGPVG